jgi:hypothetical protein
MATTPQRVTSRLVKKERKKLIRQTVYFGGIAVVIVMMFIFVILPGFLSLFDKFLSGSNPFESEDTLPPQIPMISPPVGATSSANVKLDGFGEPESEVILLLNAVKSGSVVISEEGSFSIDLKLEEGENTIELYAIDLAGNESNSTKTYVSILDTKKPKLEITSPEDGATLNGLSSQNISVKGSTDSGSKVYINGRLSFANADGEFSQQLQLEEGKNEIEIRAVDQANNESGTTITVNLKF